MYACYLSPKYCWAELWLHLCQTCKWSLALVAVKLFEAEEFLGSLRNNCSELLFILFATRSSSPDFWCMMTGAWLVDQLLGTGWLVTGWPVPGNYLPGIITWWPVTGWPVTGHLLPGDFLPSENLPGAWLTGDWLTCAWLTNDWWPVTHGLKLLAHSASKKLPPQWVFPWQYSTSGSWCSRDVNEWRLKAEGLVRAPQRLLNVEFDWDLDHLSYQPPVKGPPIQITNDMVKKAISQMKASKAPGPSDIVVEMIRAASDMGTSTTSQLQSFAMARYPLTGSRVSLFASTRERGMHWKGATTANYLQRWQSSLWKSWRGLWMASSDSWCQSTIPILASSQAEAQQTQSLLSGSCKRSI